MSRQNKIRGLTVIGCLIFLTGCFPYVARYVHVGGEEIRHKREACNFGAPVAAVYEIESVEFEVSLDPRYSRPAGRREAYVQIRASARHVLTMPDPTMTFIVINSAAERLAVSLLAMTNGTGELIASGQIADRNVYRMKFSNTPERGAAGHFRLPTINVNGKPIAQPLLTFDLRGHASVLPLNC